MKAPYGLALLAVAGLSVLALWPTLQADEPAKPREEKPVDVGSLPEVQDVIFFTEKRPVLMRMHLYVDGKPGSERWEAFQKKLFEYLDVDGDGFLDKEEAKRIIPPMALAPLFSGNPNINVGQSAPAFEEIDTDKDGKISPAELAAYYLRNNAGPYAVATGAGRSDTADKLTTALFAALDANKDGTLTQQKLQTADQVLMRFDDNDDELVTPQELLAVASNPYAPPPRRPGMPANTGVTNIVLVPKEEAGKRSITQRLKIVKDVLTRYDKDKSGKLSRAEIGFPKEVFDALDSNKDGELDPVELLRWVVATPDVECTVRLGRIDDQTKFIEPTGDGKSRSGLKLNITSQTTLALALQNSEVSVQRGVLPRVGAAPQVQILRRIFQMIDKDNTGVIALKDDPEYGSLKTIFHLAKREDSEKLTVKELDAFLDFLASASGAQLVITFTDNGQGLFDLLDSNGDGRLSIREMRNAWSRLSAFAQDGALTKSDIPRQYALLVGGPQVQNGRGILVDQSNPGRVGGPPRGVAAQRGPLWFRKMDVNGDGDVSEREFLGSKEDFRRINTSGDGLISVEEAEKADTWFREKSQQK